MNRVMCIAIKKIMQRNMIALNLSRILIPATALMVVHYPNDLAHMNYPALIVLNY